jgi:hypothetical protein
MYLRVSLCGAGRKPLREVAVVPLHQVVSSWGHLFGVLGGGGGGDRGKQVHASLGDLVQACAAVVYRVDMQRTSSRESTKTWRRLGTEPTKLCCQAGNFCWDGCSCGSSSIGGLLSASGWASSPLPSRCAPCPAGINFNTGRCMSKSSVIVYT